MIQLYFNIDITWPGKFGLGFDQHVYILCHGVYDEYEAWLVCTVMYCGGERGEGGMPLLSPHPSMVRDRAACPNALHSRSLRVS